MGRPRRPCPHGPRMSHCSEGCRTADYIERTYGLTPADYRELLEQQGGVCAFCLCPFESAKSRHVDHDHSTGKVRGLLCRHCNTNVLPGLERIPLRALVAGLTALDDSDPDHAAHRRAVIYLICPPAQQVSRWSEDEDDLLVVADDRARRWVHRDFRSDPRLRLFTP